MKKITLFTTLLLLLIPAMTFAAEGTNTKSSNDLSVTFFILLACFIPAAFGIITEKRH
ncbi:hypothetical protein [Bacillus sp. HMF5848]|uniref:hypothetical protein n=1 Tax=Bacillus sp. HMF5848 TaxID=2495421 RepID=UPI0016397AA5|nr:hypothetical protein [Bacillus sp. HMF5848]